MKRYVLIFALLFVLTAHFTVGSATSSEIDYYNYYKSLRTYGYSSSNYNQLLSEINKNLIELNKQLANLNYQSKLRTSNYIGLSYTPLQYTSYRYNYLKSYPSIAENGSYYGQISELTNRPKTVYVHGYFRKDGTYVRSHYRSLPKDR